MNKPCFFAALLASAALLSTGCSGVHATESEKDTASVPALMIQYGCPTCHVIPGVPGAVGKVGPSLESFAQRSYLAGVLPNTPPDLQRWLMHPQQIEPGTAMPEMGVTSTDAARMARFLNNVR